jgi:predicted nucleic acid-binding protein
MILCDTNILINAFNNRVDTVDQLNKIGLTEIMLSAITVMELFQGMRNKAELA